MGPFSLCCSGGVRCVLCAIQVGTGVMVGLPGQTLRDLAGDIRFFKELNANMIGMGPYITEPGTPVAGGAMTQRPKHMACTEV